MPSFILKEKVEQPNYTHNGVTFKTQINSCDFCWREGAVIPFYGDEYDHGICEKCVDKLKGIFQNGK